jgi:uncharacterized protein YabE (DUF348 family)
MNYENDTAVSKLVITQRLEAEQREANLQVGTSHASPRTCLQNVGVRPDVVVWY